MKRKRFLITALVLFILLTAGWLYNMYQKPRADVDTIKASYFVTAQKLYDDFAANENAANRKYTDKVIEVRGAVSNVQQINSTAMVLSAADNDRGGINCSLRKVNQPMPANGETITVKGRCTGFLMDVNLVDAVLINQ